jgi:hypothetical protein
LYAFLLISGKLQAMFSLLLFNIVMEALISTTKTGRKKHPEWKERSKTVFSKLSFM